MAQSDIANVIQAIASETNTPPEIVAKVYAQTWAEFSEGARVFAYLEILVIRRVRQKLRSASDNRQ
ncbi:hypothetical protein WJ36_05585 [Burkholderia ubonensis]|uniref:DUF3562 domain-containing protein n=1 Tax=Burkholderia ubonensis TaxID=101571 RepID=UPI000751B5DA|nr:DUF3562 domain-containing protein [Burkholderia ubonensis]KVG85656.1 hypothetical protein WJ36_05585 [Burkholderia ubonensis]